MPSPQEVVIMQVKCKICGKLIDREIAYNVVIKDKNNYYCSEQEYNDVQNNKKQEQELKDNTYKFIEEIIGRTTNTILYKEVGIWLTVSDYKTILAYLKENKTTIENILSSKSFNTEYAKIRYFSAIVKNNISNFKAPTQEIVKHIDNEIYETKFKQKTRRKCLADYEDGEEI